MTSLEGRIDEETPLLQGKARTPVPWGQVSIVYVSQIAEPLSFAYIFPFINQLIGELGITGGDDRKIGYYAGLIESVFFVAQVLTTWQWSRLSDFIGRRPVILIGLLGVSVSTFAFGLSRSLSTLIISRCLGGILNGNVGVIKSILGDLTDATNMAQAFAFMPAIFCIGMTVAPLYGGALSKPQERWPHIFRGNFWATYPYFLPSLISGTIILLVFLICAVFLKESLESKTGKQPQRENTTAESPTDDPASNDVGPISIPTLLATSSVMIPVTNYGILALMDIGFYILLPLFYSSPIRIGGLGLSPPIIGTILATFGIVDGCVQGLLAAKMVRWLGAKRVFCWAILWFYPLITLFPIMSAVVSAQGKVGPVIWILIFAQLVCMVLMDLSYTVIFMFVTRSAPNKQSLGSVNGISQSLASIARAVGPALTTSLFAASKQYNVMGGNFVYVVMALVAATLVALSRRLPELEEEE